MKEVSIKIITHDLKPEFTKTGLRSLIDTRDRDIQKIRIAFGNRKDAIIREVDDASSTYQYQLIDGWHNIFERIEEEIDKDIAKMVKLHPMFKDLTSIKGVGPMFAAKLLCFIDISIPNTPSQLLRYCGYGLSQQEDGTFAIDKKTKGEKLKYNDRLKTALRLIATSFLKCKSPYAEIYYNARQRIEEAEKAKSPLHAHNMALRKVIRLFVHHLWEHWREMEGLETRTPYILQFENHTTYLPKSNFGWPEVKK